MFNISPIVTERHLDLGALNLTFSGYHAGTSTAHTSTARGHLNIKCHQDHTYQALPGNVPKGKKRESKTNELVKQFGEHHFCTFRMRCTTSKH